LLFPLEEAGEIFPVGPLLPVPHTSGWFVGVANLRGGLHGVVDLGSFLRGGGASTPRAANDPEPAAHETGRLVALNPALECNAALLVDRLAGLRNLSQLKRQGSDDDGLRPAFAGERYLDGDGRLWQEVRLAALASDPVFLKIVG
jgi:twitching motility protein PilI